VPKAQSAQRVKAITAYIGNMARLKKYTALM
jgi:hypothetical protein